MRPIVLASLAALLALLLSGCSEADRQQSMVCVAIATAIGPDHRPVTIRSVERLGGIDNAVRVIFTATGDPRTLFADCAFAGGALSIGRTEIIAVRGYEGPMPGWRLALLDRWFLDQPGAVMTAVGETGWQPPSFALLSVAPPAAVGYALQQTVNALNLAAFYVPLALAYALIYGLIGRINMAFGEMAMIGSFGAVFGLVTAIEAHVPSLAGILAMALAVAVSLTALAGWLTTRTIVLPLIERPPRSFIVATVGLGLVISEGLRIAQGSREIWLQPMLESQIVLTGGPFPVVITAMRTLVVVTSALAVLGLMLCIRRSSFGRAWRAVADDRMMARLCGIDPGAVTAFTFILAASIAALAGTIVALSYGGTSYSGGFLLGLKALIACLIGGGTLGGAVIGGLLLAALETGWSAYFGSGERDIFVLVVMTILFLLRPDGLIGCRAALEEGRLIRLS
ncbi:MAG TPA: branched-chain amino acid ABC transporter permease [Kaistia sp.]|nr:branched-chain amino acid ABC transporter permease [Kaistia sp.]